MIPDKKPIKCHSLEFVWSDIIQGYYADIGEHQIQITTEDGGAHWAAQLILDNEPIEGHSPSEVVQLLEPIIVDLKSLLEKIVT